MTKAAGQTGALYRNGIALAMSGGLSSLVGSLYWMLAARQADRPSVGEATALISALTGLSYMCQLGLGGALTAFLPKAGEHARRLIAGAYIGAAGLSVLLGLIFASLAARMSTAFAVLQPPKIAFFFAVSVAIWSLFGLQDNVFTGLQKAVVVPIENAAYSVAKLIMLAAFGGGLTGLAMFTSWVLPAAIAVIPASVVLLVWLRPAGRAPSPPGLASDFRKYLAGDSAAELLSQFGTTFLPVFVVVRLGAAEGAAFGISWLIICAVDEIPGSLGISLTVEGAQPGADSRQLQRAMLRRILPIIIGIVLVLVAAAPLVLAIFGPTYRADATTVLRLLLLGSVARTVIILELCTARAQRRAGWLVRIEALLAVLVLSSIWLLGGSLGLTGVGLAWFGSQTATAFVVLAAGRAQGSGVFRFCPALSGEAVEIASGGRGGVVAAAVQDVAVASPAEGVDDGGTQGREVRGAVSSPDGASVFTEDDATDVADLVLHAPVGAGKVCELGGTGLLEGQVGEDVDGFAAGPPAGLPPPPPPPPPPDLHSLPGMREVQVGHGRDLQDSGLVPAVAVAMSGACGGDAGSGQPGQPGT